MAMLSDDLRRAVKLSGERQYRIAHAAGVHPVTLSAWLNGIRHPRPGDARVIAVGQVVGVPAERCFTNAAEGPDKP